MRRSRRLFAVSLVLVAVQAGAAYQSVHEFLAGMPTQERGNARIQLFEDSPLARDLESFWNLGEYDSALQLSLDYHGVELGIAWRTPLRAPGTDWQGDLPIGRDTAEQVELATYAGDTVFCILRGSGGGYAGWWTANLWCGPGSTWQEKYLFWTLYPMDDISAACLGNHCYVAFPRPYPPEDAALARLRVSDTLLDPFPGGASYLIIDSASVGATVDDIALCSSADSSLYYGLISGSWLRLWRLDTLRFRPDTIVPWLHGAGLGLDLALNAGGTTYRVLVSYLGDSNLVHVCGVWGDTVVFLSPGRHASWQSYTSAAAGKDTFLVCFGEYDSTGVPRAAWLESNNGGISWVRHYFSAGFDTTAYVNVCQRGVRQAATYVQTKGPSFDLMYTSRDTPGNWLQPESIQDQGRTFWGLPAITFLDANTCGIAYIWNSGAWFDYGSVGIEEGCPPTGHAVRVHPTFFTSNPLVLPPEARPSALLDASGRQVAVLGPGRNDVGHIAAGVYFAVAPDSRERIRVVKLR